jgi:hypothetical protein
MRTLRVGEIGSDLGSTRDMPSFQREPENEAPLRTSHSRVKDVCDDPKPKYFSACASQNRTFEIHWPPVDAVTKPQF